MDALIVDIDRVIEVAKEFGGGFAAYWTHHMFHKVWHATGHLSRLRPRRLTKTLPGSGE